MTARMRILTVVGNRPQFIKTAVLSPLLRTRFIEILVHTGQHYDANMSALFFRELAIPAPDVRLDTRPAAEMARALEFELKRYVPDCVLVYGDTNSTLAGVLAAVRCGVPVIHVEAGARSYDRRMPEESNRLVADHSADLLLCSSQRCRDNLAQEGIVRDVVVVGDLLLDLLKRVSARVGGWRNVVAQYAPSSRKYALLTVHRPSNTDNRRRMAAILSAVQRAGQQVIWPVHPRCTTLGFPKLAAGSQRIHPIPPQGYLDFLALLKHARVVVTDSGGVQKEAYWLGVPCLTLREQTEWVETVEAGWNRLVGADGDKIAEGVSSFRPSAERPEFYGNGQAGRKILEALSEWGRKRQLVRF